MFLFVREFISLTNKTQYDQFDILFFYYLEQNRNRFGSQTVILQKINARNILSLFRQEIKIYFCLKWYSPCEFRAAQNGGNASAVFTDELQVICIVSIYPSLGVHSQKWKENSDRSDSFPFDYEPNGSSFGS